MKDLLLTVRLSHGLWYDSLFVNPVAATAPVSVRDVAPAAKRYDLVGKF